jgi:hypothetical protein
MVFSMRTTVGRGASVSPRAFPDIVLAVNDFVPEG